MNESTSRCERRSKQKKGVNGGKRSIHKRERELRLIKMRVVRMVVDEESEKNKQRGRGRLFHARTKSSRNAVSAKHPGKKNRAAKSKDRKGDTLANRIDVEKTRVAIRDLIQTLERSQVVEGDFKKGAPRDSSDPKEIVMNEVPDPDTVLEQYADLQRTQAKQSLHVYEASLREEMERVLHDQRRQRTEKLSVEREAIEAQFVKDEEDIVTFERFVESKISELQALKTQANSKLADLRAYQKQCICACEERHRIEMEEIEVELRASMNEKVRTRNEEIQKKLAAALAPSPW